MDIFEIAQLAGVSIATVSRVINSRKGVKDRNRLKVLGIIRQYGYYPNAFAQHLGRRKAKNKL